MRGTSSVKWEAHLKEEKSAEGKGLSFNTEVESVLSFDRKKIDDRS